MVRISSLRRDELLVRRTRRSAVSRRQGLTPPLAVRTASECQDDSPMGTAQRKTPRPFVAEGSGRCLEDSGDHRLSRQRHYHGPDGLNGRVRNGNGWDPVSMVAGKATGRRSNLPITGGWSTLRGCHASSNCNSCGHDRLASRAERSRHDTWSRLRMGIRRRC